LYDDIEVTLMERKKWLEEMRSRAEALYDHGAPLYWGTWGMDNPESHRATLLKFLGMLPPSGNILSAACGAGRFDGFLVEAGHNVVGVDQSAGMLARAREHFPEDRFPQLHYEKLGLQEIAGTPTFQAAFDGIICMDSMEHICPEDYPGILRGFHAALKPGGVLYITVETHETALEDVEDLTAAYERAKAKGLPVAPGEVVDELDNAFPLVMADREMHGEVAHNAVYRFYPPLEQVQVWLAQAGLVILEEGHGDDVHHIIARRE
jgi:2-polyprenyl-3-methyl-5-hydroxy-6-metoxy-1,4-benzoquinol methylase